MPAATVELESRALALARDAESFAIASAQDYTAAGTLLLQLGQVSRAWTDAHAESVQAAHASWKASVKVRDSIPSVLEPARAALSRRMGAWQAEQEARRIADERQAQQEAQLSAAVEAEQAGDPGMAQALLDGQALVPPVILRSVVPAVEGISSRETWKFEITDATLVTRDFLAPDLVKIGGYVRAMKGAAKIPGVRVWAETSVAGRRT